MNKPLFIILLHLLLLAGLLLLAACNSNSGHNNELLVDSMAPREATDPVPFITTLPDTTASPDAVQEKLYTVVGNEPFWKLEIGRPFSYYRSAQGDSVRFAYREPIAAAARPQEFAQLFPLGANNWLLLRKGTAPCSDGMSSRQYAFSATLFIKGELLAGCGEAQGTD